MDEQDESLQETARSSSPVWLGAFATTFLGLAAGWILLYTLLDLGWIEPLGAWNYLVAVVLSTIALQSLHFWRGDPPGGA